MKIDKFYILSRGKFADTIKSWANDHQIEVVEQMNGSALYDVIDGAILFHINHNISKELNELHKEIDMNNRPIHKIDVNGTLAATVSNFTMWIERNKPERILVLGGDEVENSNNLHRFLTSIVEVNEKI